MKEISCELLSCVERARTDPDGGFEPLYNMTVKSAFRYAGMYLKYSEDIEDALQLSYINLYKSITKLQKPESFEYWFHKIIRHECQKILNSHSMSERVFGMLAGFFYDEEDPHENVEEIGESSEMRTMLAETVEALPSPQKLCVVMFYFDGMKIGEIADELSVPVGTVKSRLHKAKQTIEKRLRDSDTDGVMFAGLLPMCVASLAGKTAENVLSETLRASVLTGVTSAVSGTALGAAASATAAASAGSTAAASAATAATVGTSAAVKVAAVAAAVITVGGGAVGVKTVRDRQRAAETAALVSETLEYNAPETTVQTIEIISEENGTTAVITETSVVTVTAAADSTAAFAASETLSAVTTPPASTTAAQQTTARTTVPSTAPATTKATTAKPTTAATTQKPTEAPTTQKPTTARQTTKADDLSGYAAEGGVLKSYSGSGTDISVPESLGVTAVGTGAFAGNTSVRSVSLPSGVEKIGQEAFSDCTSLRSVSLPSSLKSIGIGAFYGCTSLSSLSVPSGVSSIGDEAFADCGALTSVTVPSTVTSIGDGAFDGCDNLTIKCREGSAAQNYAEENGINYVLI